MSAIIDLAVNEKHYQAAKYLADRGWEVDKVGRPSKEQVEGELKKRADEASEFDDDFNLIKLYKGK